MLKYSNSIHSAGFRGIYFGSVDTALTRGERENRNQLRINYLRFIVVPRTGLEPARLSALAPETSASTIPPPGLLCDVREVLNGWGFPEMRCKVSDVF